MKQILHWTGNSYQPIDFDQLEVNKNIMIKIVEIVVMCRYCRKELNEDQITNHNDLVDNFCDSDCAIHYSQERRLG